MEENFFIFGFGNVSEFRWRQFSGAMQQYITRVRPEILNVEKTEKQHLQIRRTRHGDFRIATNNNRVAVMPRVAPTPRRGFAQHHERRDFVERVVHPIRLERRAVTRFVPARIRGGSVNHAVNSKWKNRPPTAPPVTTPNAGRDEQCEPDDGIADSWAVAATKQFAHFFFRNRRRIPSRLGQSVFNREGGVFAHETVIT